jgi:hypothetical protein
MIETKPWPDNEEVKSFPANAVTVELTQDEVLQALATYVGNARGDKFPATAWIQYRNTPGKTTIRLTYWCHKEESQS